MGHILLRSPLRLLLLTARNSTSFASPARGLDGNPCFSRQVHGTGVARFSTSATTLSEPVAPENVVGPNDADNTNEFGVQLLDSSLKNQLFPQAVQPQGTAAAAASTEDRLNIARSHLKHHELYGKRAEPLRPVSFQLPPLLGSSIQEHFWTMGHRQADPYIKLARKFAESDLPPLPQVWSSREGWTRYDTFTGEEKAVPYPLEEAIAFDTEVLQRCSEYPVIATAVSSEAWYSWISPDLTRMDESFSSKTLIPLGPVTAAKEGVAGGARLVVGHHVAYDRARVKEEYAVRAPRRGYLDTLSLHVAGAGLAARQRNVWMKYIKDENSIDEVDKLFCKEGAMNSLVHLVWFYLNEVVDKTIRNVFVDGTLRDVENDVQSMMKYCARDTKYAHGVLRPVLHKFLEKCPHPASFAGVIHMGQSIITVDESWQQYLRRSEEACQEKLNKEAMLLQELAEKTALLPKETWTKDPWLRNMDWTSVRLTRAGKHVPAWYKQLYDNKIGKLNVTRRSRATPYLMRLQWLGYPICFSRNYGWCFRVGPDDPTDRLPPDSVAVDFSSVLGAGSDHVGESNLSAPEMKGRTGKALASKIEFDAAALADVRETGARYYRIPHQDGGEANCGSPLARGFVDALEKGDLSSEDPRVKDLIESGVVCGYWTSNRERIMKQFVVYEDDIHGPPEENGGVADVHSVSNASGTNNFSDQVETSGTPVPSQRRQGYIIPQLITMATITRRAVERTWLTASNPREDRIGSELKSMVRAPPGHKIVGADVDSQELWICSVLGDAQFGAHGSTALGWMTVQGSKAAGTDMHSLTAKVLGIDRNQAKQFNYARIYGAGVDFTCHKLSQYSPDLEKAEARRKAEELYGRTKGTKIRNKLYPTLYNGMYYGGSESFSFNSIEHIALRNPRTPTLQCEISDALGPKATKKFLTSKANWTVQSSGVDYLHMLLVAMEYLTSRHGIQARYMISLHDELRYLVADRDVERAALALQIANVWTRAMFAARLGMDNLPLSAAFFSCVDIDTVLRKEVTTTCITPSQKDAISPGEMRDIFATLERTGGGDLGPVVDRTYDEAAACEPIPEHLAGTSSSLLPVTTTLLKLQACMSEEDVGRVVAGVPPKNGKPGQRRPRKEPMSPGRAEAEDGTDAAVTTPNHARVTRPRCDMAHQGSVPPSAPAPTLDRTRGLARRPTTPQKELFPSLDRPYGDLSPVSVVSAVSLGGAEQVSSSRERLPR